MLNSQNTEMEMMDVEKRDVEDVEDVEGFNLKCEACNAIITMAKVPFAEFLLNTFSFRSPISC